MHLFRFYELSPEKELPHEQIGEFLSHLSRHCQQWQVVQASEAIQVYFFFRRHHIYPDVLQRHLKKRLTGLVSPKE